MVRKLFDGEIDLRSQMMQWALSMCFGRRPRIVHQLAHAFHLRQRGIVPSLGRQLLSLISRKVLFFYHRVANAFICVLVDGVLIKVLRLRPRRLILKAIHIEVIIFAGLATILRFVLGPIDT